MSHRERLELLNHWSVLHSISTVRKKQSTAEWINYFWIDDYWWSCLSMLCFKTFSFIASLFSAALRYSQTSSQQRASTYHSPFHPSCPHSRCHGHRPNGQECSADYHNETRSLCTRVELRENTKTEVKRCGSSKHGNFCSCQMSRKPTQTHQSEGCQKLMCVLNLTLTPFSKLSRVFKCCLLFFSILWHKTPTLSQVVFAALLWTVNWHSLTPSSWP